MYYSQHNTELGNLGEECLRRATELCGITQTNSKHKLNSTGVDYSGYTHNGTLFVGDVSNQTPASANRTKYKDTEIKYFHSRDIESRITHMDNIEGPKVSVGFGVTHLEEDITTLRDYSISTIYMKDTVNRQNMHHMSNLLAIQLSTIIESFNINQNTCSNYNNSFIESLSIDNCVYDSSCIVDSIYNNKEVNVLDVPSFNEERFVSLVNREVSRLRDFNIHFGIPLQMTMQSFLPSRRRAKLEALICWNKKHYTVNLYGVSHRNVLSCFDLTKEAQRKQRKKPDRLSRLEREDTEILRNRGSPLVISNGKTFYSSLFKPYSEYTYANAVYDSSVLFNTLETPHFDYRRESAYTDFDKWV
jgi:hypothetical protein